MIYKAYKDDCYLIGICNNGIFDGYIEITPAEKKEYERVEEEYFKWQDKLKETFRRRPRRTLRSTG